MKVAFLYKFFPSCGGVERVMTILANEFTKQGIIVYIYSFRQCLERSVYNLDPSVEIMPLPESLHIESALNVSFLVKDLSEKQVDVLFNHDTTSDSMKLCQRIKRGMSIKLVTLHHGQIYLPRTSLRTVASKYPATNLRNVLFPLYCLYDRVKRYCSHQRNIRISDAYVLLSDTFRRQLGGGRKIWVIPNPLSFSEFFRMDDYAGKENLVLMVGRISEIHKRFSIALQIWQWLEDRSCLGNWRFEIVGDGEDRSFVEKLIKEKGLKRVRMVGQAQPESYYRRAKLLMMTSAFEGFGLVLMEASQYACVPVVMDSFETLHDMITDGVNGRITLNNDIDAFTEAMQLLMIEPTGLKRMAAAAVENSHRYAPSSLVEKWIELFKNVCNK